MKKYLIKLAAFEAAFLLVLAPLVASAQSYPAPTFSSVVLQNPLTPANGGTGATSSTGTGSVALSNSPTFTTPNLGTPSAVTLTHGTGLPVSTGVSGLGTGVATALGNGVTGSGNIVLATSPTLVTPVLGTPSSVTLTNGTGLPVAGLTGLGTGVATALGSAVTGSGGPVLATSPSIASAALTGTSTAVTAALGTSTTQIATTAFVAAGKACPSILDFGGNGGGTVDNTAAFNAAVASQASTQICVSFPAGVYAFTSSLSITLPNSLASITLQGQGSYVTQLKWPSASNGITINEQSQLNSFHIRGLQLVTGSAPASGSAVTLTQSGTLAASNDATEQSDFIDVSIHGADGPGQTDYWTTGVTDSGVSVINFVNFKVDGEGTSTTAGYTTVGTGVNLQASGSIIPVQFNFTNSNFTFIGTGILYGNLVQGVTVSQSNFTGGNIGIWAPPSISGLAQLAVVASQFNDLANGIETDTPIGGTLITNSAFFSPKANSSGIFLGSTEAFSIVGNSFFGPGSSTSAAYGIVVGSNPNADAGLISGNVFFNYNGASSVGVLLQSGSSLVTVQGNSYSTVTTNVSNSGTSNVVSGALFATKVITSTQTYTPDYGTNSVRVRICGGGGAGGGTPATTSSQYAVSGGGGSGAWAEGRITSGYSGVTVTIGAGGSGASGVAGGAGGTSSFGALITAPGGSGGAASAATTNTSSVSASGGAGATGASGGSLFNTSGAQGGYGLAINGVPILLGGVGASMPYGVGGANSFQATGAAAQGSCSGGGGVASNTSQAAFTGGAGAKGIAIIEEYN